MALAGSLNRYLDDAAPWKTLKTDPGAGGDVALDGAAGRRARCGC